MFIILLFFSLATTLLGQSEAGRIAGRVIDPTGAVIVASEVIASNESTGLVYRAVSGSSGIYVLPSLPPGRYLLAVLHAGFKKYERPGIVLGTNENISLDVLLELGSAAETVTVHGTPPLLEAATSDVAQLVEAKSVAEMPLNGRRALSLVALAGATVWVDYLGDSKPNFSLAGGRARSQMFWLDGGNTQFARMGVGQVTIDPPVEVIREFRVLQNTYSAEFGGSAGGLLISTTKSGTNRLHGSAFEYFRNDKLDARNFFSTYKPPLRYHLFGATLGGPVRKNRTHYFAGYEGTRRSTGQVDSLTVPSVEQRRGDFSQTTNAAGALIRVFDPSTNRIVAGRNVRDQFPNNVIPASRQDPVAVKLMDFYPLAKRPPSNRAGANNFVANYANLFNRDNVTVKVDHILTQNNRFYVRFVYNNDPIKYTSVHPNRISDTRNDQLRWQESLLLADTQTIGPNLMTEIRMDLSVSTAHHVSPGLGSNAVELLGLKGVPSGAFPTVSVAGLARLGSSPHERGGSARLQQQYVNSWTWVRASHALKFGGEIRRSARMELLKTSISGNFSFATQPTALEGAANTGSATASLLVGFPNSFSLRATEALDRHTYYLAAYLQDDWKVHRDLTLNLGVRWETDTPMIDGNNRMNGFDALASNPVSQTPGVVRFLGRDGVPNNPYDPDWNNFGPRIGFAWQPWGRQKTVLRGGFGVYFAHPFDRGVPNLASLGFENSLNLSTPDNGVTPPFLLRDGPRSVQADRGVLDDRFGAVRVGQNPTTDVQFFERSRRIGYSQQFNLGVQRELPGGILLDLSLLGNLSRKLAMDNLNINQIPPHLVDAVRPAGVFRQAYRPFPQFNGVTALAPSFGVTDYYAGVLKVERRFAQGLGLLATYTWAKNIGNLDEDSGDLGDDQQYSNYYNRRADKGPDALDIRHRLSWSSVYELPAGRGRRWLQSGPLSRILGGWTVGAISTIQSGGPLTVTTQTNTTNVFSSGAQRANVLRNPNLPNSRKTPTNWFDTSAFEAPAPFTFGNSGRSLVRADGRVNFDFSLGKNFEFSESSFLQFRSELFNAFNHPDFGLPGAALGSPGFGVVNTATAARTVQFGLRMVF